MKDKQIIINGCDVSKCAFYNNGKCNNPNGMACNCCNNAYCYYKELQQLKQENEELRKSIEILKDTIKIQARTIDKTQSDWFNNFSEIKNKYELCLDEIEKYIYTDCEYNDGCDRNICIRCKYSNIHDKRILQLIKQAKEN